MKNKTIGLWSIGSLVAFLVAVMCGGEYGEGVIQFIYFITCIAFYVFTIWGWVRLIKSNE